jgi:hypothetical protein
LTVPIDAIIIPIFIIFPKRRAAALLIFIISQLLLWPDAETSSVSTRYEHQWEDGTLGFSWQDRRTST